MKKGLVLIAALALMAGMAPSLFAEPAGELPQMVQAGFYTKTYQCFYLKGTDELGLKYTANEWNTYETEIGKKTITYDGMNGKHKKLALLRVKSNTKKSNVPLVIYVDNVTLKDEDGNVVFSLDFEPLGHFGLVGTGSSSPFGILAISLLLRIRLYFFSGS